MIDLLKYYLYYYLQTHFVQLAALQSLIIVVEAVVSYPALEEMHSHSSAPVFE